MQYRTFGKTGIKVSPYALGAMMFGAVGNPDHEDSVRIIHKALEAGINFIDTAVEQIIPVAEQAGLKLTHMAVAFAISHPGVTSAIIGPRTMEHLDDLLAGADVALSNDVLEQLDAIVPPGTDVGRLDMAYIPPAILNPALRRREAAGRSAV
jgi:aryl-alcohol dehydrogenase-like predicted oxidoreductase